MTQMQARARLEAVANCGAVVLDSEHEPLGGNCMQKVGLFCALALAFGALLIAGTAAADIKSFNAAMKAKDYKAAAAEAATTWPTLDKSRKDLAVIAREFGFAAYLSGDFAGAKIYGEAALTASRAQGEAPELQMGSETLTRLAEHRMAPSEATRDKMYAVLAARTEHPGVDLVSYFAADEALAFDFKRGDWKDAMASAGVGSKLSGNGGAFYLVQHLRFDLFASVARYMIDKEQPAYDDLDVLHQRVIDAINAAESDEAAKPLETVYWDIRAWREALGNHLAGRRKLKVPEAAAPHEMRMRSVNDRAVRLLDLGAEDKPCQLTIDMKRNPQYPKSALYKGLIGVVILRVDVDAQGKSLKPEILGAVPDKIFGDAVMRSVKDLRHLPGEKWGPDCAVQRTGRVITFMFSMG
jgi:TonB family protein